MADKVRLRVFVLAIMCSLFFSATSIMASSYNDSMPTVVTMTCGKSTYTVNGESFESDTTPFTSKEGRLMVSLSTLADALGVSRGNISVENGIISLINDDYIVVQFKVGKSIMVLNGAQVPLGCKAVEKNGRVYLPAKYVAMALGYNVDYNKDTQLITFYKNSAVSSYTQVALPTDTTNTEPVEISNLPKTEEEAVELSDSIESLSNVEEVIATE